MIQLWTRLFRRIRRKIKTFFSNQGINKRISKYKYVHVMVSEKFCEPYIDFVARQYDSNEHVFLVQKNGRFDIPNRKNVIEIIGMDGLSFSDRRIKSVIMHSLFIGECCWYWSRHLRVLQKKAFWMIWGGDLYGIERNWVNDCVRSRFHGYISDTDGDCENAIKTYHVKDAVWYNSAYTFPISLEMVDSAIDNKEYRQAITIQVNNSCDKSTLSMLDLLSKHSRKNLIVKTTLSYGEMQYKEDIIQKGKSLFGSNFVSLDTYLAPEEYAKWIANADIFILCQDRQQGLGNAMLALATGAKLYIKSSVTTFSHFMNHNITVFDTLDIENQSFEEFVNYDSCLKNRNMKYVRSFFTDNYLKECWDPIFFE